MCRLRTVFFSLTIALLSCHLAHGAPSVPAGAKIFIAPMNGYETFVKAAIEKKKLPIAIVEKREDAQFEISGASESQKAGVGKILITGSWHSTEDASIKLTNIETSVVVFAYSVHKANSVHGKQSSAEACAKHLGDAIKTK